MIASPDASVVLSSLGWVDGDAIWCFNAASGAVRTIPLNTGARYSTLHSANNERFIVVHHFDGAKFMASVGLFSAPELTVSSAGYENGRPSLSGNTDAWSGMPQLFVEYLKSMNDFVLVKIDGGHVHVQRLEWYDSSYDKDYQGVVDVIALPDPRYALVSVQRCSELVVHDLETGQAAGKVPLAGRSGNPKLALPSGGRRLWASDFDSLVLVDVESRRVVRKKKLQGAVGGTQQFIGDYSLSSDGACCVSRPYSGDVVEVDDQLKIRKRASLGRQPFEAIALRDGRVIARDWETGDLLSGRFEAVGWFQGLF